MNTTKIEWTEKTWNPTTGCSKISAGCKNCYAEPLSKRLNAMGVKKYINNFQITEHQGALLEPLKWKKPQMVFVNSMSDLFHEGVSDEFILKVFEVIKNTKHTYQILTKRADRLKEFEENVLKGQWPNNVWMGVSVENKETASRIAYLTETTAKVKFLSIEPLLGPLLNVDLKGVDWAIVGGESGHKARPMKPEWVINIQKQCEAQKVSFFFKQWGTWGQDGVKRSKKVNGRLLLGKEWNEKPVLID